MTNLKKFVAIGATASMILWSLGTALPVGATAISDGDLVKTADSSAIYYIQGAYKRVFPHVNVYLSWGYPSDFSTVKTVTAAELAAYADANAVTFRDGSLFRGTTSSLGGQEASAVFFVSDATLRAVKSAAIYQALFNDASWSKVTWVPDDLLTKFNYDIGSMIESSSTHADGCIVKYSGETQKYIISGGKKRAISEAAFTANRYREADVLTIQSSETYTNGDAITGSESGLLTPGWSGISTSGLTVSLAAGNPSGATIPDGSSNVSLLKTRLTAGANAVSITGLTFKRLGVGATTVWDSVYVYADDVLLTSTGRSISSDSNEVEFPVLSISVPANSSKTVELRGDVADGQTAGSTHSFQLKTVVTSATVTGLPISGNSFVIGTEDISTITLAAGTAPTNPTIGATAAEIATFRITAGSNNISFRQITLSFSGSLAKSNVSNLKLYQESTLLASVASIASNDTATFTLSSAYSVTKGQNKTFKVKADLGGRVTETLVTRLEEASHIAVNDVIYGYGARLTTTCPAASNTVTMQGGAITMTDNGPVAGYIGKNTQDVELTKIAITADRNAEVRRLDVVLLTDGTDILGTDKITDLRIKDADTGATLMSKSISTTNCVAGAACAFGAATANTNTWRLTDIWNLTANTTRNLVVTVDTGTSATIEDEYIKADVHPVAYSATEYYFRDVSTGDYIKKADVVPTSITGDNQTIQAAGLTTSLASTPVSSTVVKGANGVETVGVVFVAADASAVTLRQVGVRVHVNSASTFDGTTDTTQSGEVTAVYLYDGSTLLGTKSISNGTTYGTAAFENLNVNIPKGTNKKLIVKADISSSIAATTYVAVEVMGADISSYDADGNGLTVATNANAVSSGTAPDRYITVSLTGSLTTALDADTPVTGIVVANTNDNNISKIKFTATDESWTVNKLRIKLNTQANEGSIEAVKIAYPGGSATGYLATTGGISYVTFTGLSWLIEADTYEILTINADLKSLDANQDEAGREIKLGINCATATACEAVGDSQTVLGDTANEFSGTGTGDVQGNPQYLRKSKPTVAGVALSSTQLLDGTREFMKFSVTADSAGAITVKKFKFAVNVSDASGAGLSVTTWKIYDSADMSTVLPSTWSDGTTTSTAGTVPLTDGSANLQVELTSEKEISASSSKTFVVKGTVAGSAQYDSVTFSLNNSNDTAVKTGVLLDHSTNLVSVSTDGSTHTAVDFLWSDKAKGVNHTASNYSAGTLYKDWTNGYLIKILPTDSYSLVYPS